MRVEYTLKPSLIRMFDMKLGQLAEYDGDFFLRIENEGGNGIKIVNLSKNKVFVVPPTAVLPVRVLVPSEYIMLSNEQT